MDNFFPSEIRSKCRNHDHHTDCSTNALRNTYYIIIIIIIVVV